jgi:hypothetical protein
MKTDGVCKLQQQTWSLSRAVTLELSLQQGDKAAGEMNCRWRGGSVITCQLLPCRMQTRTSSGELTVLYKYWIVFIPWQ